MMFDENISDEHIVSKIIKGDVNSFKYLVDRYQKYIFNIGMRFFKNKDDATDFVQDIFLRAYGELRSFKGKSFRFWIVKIAYNYGINQIKAKKTCGNDSLGDAQSREPAPEASYIKDETVKLIESVLSELPEHYRICLDMYFYYGFTYKEICGITEFPVNTIKSNVLRAKEILRDKLRGSIAEDYYEM